MKKRGGNTTGKLGRRARDQRSAIQRAIDDQRDASRAAWAKRHPSVAKEERSLRKAHVERAKRWDHKRHGTPETLDRAANTHQGALAQLFANGTINAEQLEWAAEISNVYRSITSDVTVAIASLEARVDQSRRGSQAAEGVRRVRLHHAYTLWRDDLPAPKQMILDMVVGDSVGYTVAAKRYGVHNRRAKRLLLQAIDQWPAFVLRAYRDVQEIDVSALNEAA